MALSNFAGVQSPVYIQVHHGATSALPYCQRSVAVDQRTPLGILFQHRLAAGFPGLEFTQHATLVETTFNLILSIDANTGDIMAQACANSGQPG
jgi:hypothetical protein